MSLKFGNDLKGLNAYCLRGYRSMERGGVHLNLVRAIETTFDGNSDVGVVLLM